MVLCYRQEQENNFLFVIELYFKKANNFYKYFLICSPSIHSQSGHHVSGVPLLHTNIDNLPPSSNVWVPLLNDVGGVDDNVRVDIGGVDPLSGEVLGQQAARFHC